MTDLECAKSKLDGHSVVFCKDGEVIISDERGVKPLVGIIADGTDLNDYSAADKVVGKAAAMLFVKIGVRKIFAKNLSESGKEFLEKHKIDVSYETLTPFIKNRSGDGLCPMETAVKDIDDCEKGYSAVLLKLEELKNKK